MLNQVPALAVTTAPRWAEPVTVGSAVLTGTVGTTLSPHAMPSCEHAPMKALR